MSLDVYLTKVMPTEVYSSNITHNLGKMANQVLLSNGHTLYQVLWRPDEHGWKLARDIIDMLDEGWNILMSNPEKLRSSILRMVGVLMKDWNDLCISILKHAGCTQKQKLEYQDERTNWKPC